MWLFVIIVYLKIFENKIIDNFISYLKMHNILEIALGVGLGMTIFLVIIWILGTCVYVCCGKTKRIASVRKLKTFEGKNQELEISSSQESPLIEKEVEIKPQSQKGIEDLNYIV